MKKSVILEEINTKTNQLLAEIKSVNSLATELSSLCRQYSSTMGDLIRIELETNLLFATRKWADSPKSSLIRQLLEDELAYVERYGHRREEK